MKQKQSPAWLIVFIMICTMGLFGMAGCGSSSDEQAAETTTVETSAAEMISESEALENAFDAAGLYIDDADDITVQLNVNDEEAGYDIGFQMEGVNYEYFVDAYTGDVYEYE